MTIVQSPVGACGEAKNIHGEAHLMTPSPSPLQSSDAD